MADNNPLLATLTTDDLILGCVDEATAYIVQDYPYGRLRTTIRYWIESVAGKGDRFCSQTLNPKTARWNKPKKSTYAPVKLMYLERQEDGRMFVKTTGLGLWRTTDDAQRILDLVGADLLNEVQRKEIAKVIGLNKVMESVTFNVREGEQTETEKQEQAEIAKKIGRAIAVESFRAHRDLGA